MTRRPSPERELIARLARMVDSFASPDGEHKALRSAWSAKGVCETTKGCSPLCQEWRALMIEAAEYLTAHPEQAGPEQMQEAAG